MKNSHINKKSLSYFLIIVIIAAMAVSPAFALGVGNRNLLLIAVMAFSPLFLILTLGKIYRSDIWLLLFMISIVLSPLLNHPESMRWSTVLYAIMFGLTFMAYKQLLYHGNFSIENYQNLLKYLIYAYFVVLLIQQFCVLTGLPIFNVGNYSPNEPWKLNALAAEPSHSARIVALLMYSYIVITELISKRKYNFRLDFYRDKWVWLGFLWTMLTMGSATAFLFIFIVLIQFLRLKSIVPLALAFGFIILLIGSFGIETYKRTLAVFVATLTFDPDAIIVIDHSASLRIVPMMILSKMVDLTTLDGWFGHGIDYVGTFLSNYIRGIPEGSTGGGLLQIWMEYGFISFIFFVAFSFSNSYRKRSYLSVIFWILLVFINNINNQIVWLCIMLLFANKYFEKNAIKESRIEL